MSRNSERSVQSEEEEQAAIEADVDDDLEVLSSQSGEIRERESSRRERQSSSNDRPRGFSLHVKLGFSRPSHEQLNTPSEPSYTPASTGGSSTQYLAAPHTPGTPATPQTPRSDAGSAYYSNSGDEHDEHSTNQPLPGYLVSSDSSMVMYGRPPASMPDNHIV